MRYVLVLTVPSGSQFIYTDLFGVRYYRKGKYCYVVFPDRIVRCSISKLLALKDF